MTIDAIPFGHDKAVTTAILCLRFGLSPRGVRREISALLKHGNVILNLQDGKGYFRPTANDGDLVERFYRQEKHRALASLAKIKACREWSADQIRMGEEQ